MIRGRSPGRRHAAALIAALTLGACAPTTKTVPFSIQSNPLGAYVFMQNQRADGAHSDWIYLGNTPLTANREIQTRGEHGSDVIVVRVVREGYFDQSKSWSAGRLPRELKDQGKVYWNPKMVRQ